MLHILILNNGMIAQYLYHDDWSRPVYRLPSGTKVCCIDLNGTYLHTMTPGYDEPDCPLKDEYQPINDDVKLDNGIYDYSNNELKINGVKIKPTNAFNNIDDVHKHLANNLNHGLIDQNDKLSLYLIADLNDKGVK